MGIEDIAKQLYEADLIKRVSEDKIIFIERNKQWLTKHGLLPYIQLPLSGTAINKNRIKNNGNPDMVQIILETSGIDTSEEEYNILVNMIPIQGVEGINNILRIGRRLQKIEPLVYEITPAMCEMYHRISTYFTGKDESWRKNEVLQYFGHVFIDL